MDAQATGGFLGLTADVKKEHMVRAMLESLAFRVTQIYETMLKEADYNLLEIRSVLSLQSVCKKFLF